MDADKLSELIQEYLATLDDTVDEEYYNTERGHSRKWLEMFLEWVRKHKS